MNNMNTVSIAVGLLCATGGILARPRTLGADNGVRTILTAAVAAVPVLGWILLLGHPLTTGLSFLAGTLVAGELRDLQHKRSARRGASTTYDAEVAQVAQFDGTHEDDASEQLAV